MKTTISREPLAGAELRRMLTSGTWKKMGLECPTFGPVTATIDGIQREVDLDDEAIECLELIIQQAKNRNAPDLPSVEEAMDAIRHKAIVRRIN